MGRIPDPTLPDLGRVEPAPRPSTWEGIPINPADAPPGYRRPTQEPPKPPRDDPPSNDGPRGGGRRPEKGAKRGFIGSIAKFILYVLAIVFILELIDGSFGLDPSEDLWETNLARQLPPLQAIVEGELLFYIDPIPRYAAEGVKEAVDDIVTNLESQKPYGAEVRRTVQPSEADIHIGWIRDFGGDHLGTEISTHINVGLGTTNCDGEWQAFDSDTVAHTLWHEIGHAFGYGHSPDPKNVMYRGLNSRFEVDHDISQVLPQDWYMGTPICESGDYAIELVSLDDGGSFDFAVLPAGAEPEDLLDGNVTPSTVCSSGSFQTIEEECQLRIADYILIYNGSDDAIEIEGRVVSISPREPTDMQWDQAAFQIDQDLIDYFLGKYGE